MFIGVSPCCVDGKGTLETFHTNTIINYLVDDRRIASTLQQHLGQLFAPHGGGNVQRRVVVLVQLVDVGEGADQNAHHANVTVAGGAVQRSVAKLGDDRS